MMKNFTVLLCSIVFLIGTYVAAQTPEVMKLLSAPEKEWLQNHPVLSLGVDPAWPPVEMLDEKGEYKGMAADVMHLIGRRLGITIQPTSGLTWTQAIYKIRNKELDLLSAVSRTSERDAFLNYTATVIELPAVIITRHDKQENKNLNDFRGRQISVVQDYSVADWIAANYPDIVIRGYGTIDQALVALVNGDVEAYVGDIATASYTITHLAIMDVTVAAYTPYSTGLSIGVRKDWPEVIAILNKAIATITPEERTTIRSRSSVLSEPLSSYSCFKDIRTEKIEFSMSRTKHSAKMSINYRRSFMILWMYCSLLIVKETLRRQI
jgi:ABC-type amino acid transport substrate-binding protein